MRGMELAFMSIEMRASGPRMVVMEGSYARLGAMVATSTAVMFGLTYLI